jgi:L-fuculose-phosphate aldolase
MSIVLRHQLINTGIAMNECGLNEGAAGNLSLRYEKGMLITPSGMDYTGLQPDDIVWMDFDGGAEGRRKPSSEWQFHAAVYRQYPGAMAILHAHPVNCTALACLDSGIPSFHYMVARAGGRDIRCAAYATFGSRELSENVVEALEGRKACLMSHHGLTCYEEDLDKVLALAVEVEHLARIYCRVLAIGEASLIDDEEMDRVLEKFKTYGVQD